MEWKHDCLLQPFLHDCCTGFSVPQKAAHPPQSALLFHLRQQQERGAEYMVLQDMRQGIRPEAAWIYIGSSNNLRLSFCGICRFYIVSECRGNAARMYSAADGLCAVLSILYYNRKPHSLSSFYQLVYTKITLYPILICAKLIKTQVFQHSSGKVPRSV